MSEFLKLEFIDREKTFLAKIPDEFWCILGEWADFHSETKEETLGKMLISFCNFMRNDLEMHKEQSPARLMEMVLEALGIPPDVPTQCVDCGMTGYSHEKPCGRIVLCTSCVSKRKEGKTTAEFVEGLKELYERHRKR